MTPQTVRWPHQVEGSVLGETNRDRLQKVTDAKDDRWEIRGVADMESVAKGGLLSGLGTVLREPICETDGVRFNRRSRAK